MKLKIYTVRPVLSPRAVSFFEVDSADYTEGPIFAEVRWGGDIHKIPWANVAEVVLPDVDRVTAGKEIAAAIKRSPGRPKKS